MSDIRKARRVVTGTNADGKSIVVSDDRVEARTAAMVPGYGWHRLWSEDWTPVVPNAGIDPAAADHFSPSGGTRFIIFTVPPKTVQARSDLDVEAAMQEMEDKFPGRAAHMESHQAGLHTTTTVDYLYVIDGEIWLELDDEKEIHLKAGDTIIQNGTRHAWRNHSDKPCSMVVTIVGANKLA